MASDQIPEPPTSSNVDPFGEEPQYSGAKLIAVDVQASWLRSGDAAGWLAAKASMVTEESEKAITALCRRYNRRRSRGKGRDSYRILREDARDFVEVARKTPELGFWPTEKGEVVVVLNRSTEAVWSGKFRTGESAIGQPGKENGSGPAPEQAQSPSEPDVGPGVLPKALESDADRGRSENGGSGSNF